MELPNNDKLKKKKKRLDFTDLNSEVTRKWPNYLYWWSSLTTIQSLAPYHGF